MTIEARDPHDQPAHHGAYVHDSGWELPELAPVAILVSVGLLVLGSAISTLMSLFGQADLTDSIGWSLVTSALRWIDPSTSTMLLISAALIWWQYGYWTSPQSSDTPEDVVASHIARLRVISKWNVVAFLVTIMSVLLLILASVLQNTYSGAPLSIWADSVGTICMALGTILLSLLGIVALQRILVASKITTHEEGGASL